MTRHSWGFLPVWAGLSLSACSSASTGGPADAATDGSGKDATRDARLDAPHDATHEADIEPDAARDSGPDGPVPTTALVRLANFSPDSNGLDFCLAPRGTSMWSGPILGNTLGHGSLGQLTVIDAGLPVDAGHKGTDAGGGVDSGGTHETGAPDASPDVGTREAGAPDAPLDAHVPEGGGTRETGAPDASPDATSDAQEDAGIPAGARFPRFSPYVAMTPGEYDVRVVAGGALDCTAPLAPDVDDFPPLFAGTVLTFVALGDTVDQGTDPTLALGIVTDDTTVAAGSVALRFVNAVPTVIEVTFAAGTLAKGTSQPYLIAGQFGGAATDSDAGTLDSNDYLLTAPIVDQTWSLINANGSIATLVAVENANVPAGSLATVVGVGGESGQDQGNIGILLCLDTPPIVAGETAKCDLLQTAAAPVCDGCL